VTLLEVALDDVGGAAIAEGAGAHRIELCAGLADGGTTPSIGLIRSAAVELTTATLMVLVRPRAGDFVYTPGELDVMLADVLAVRDAAPAAGFALGALTPTGDVDANALRALIAAAGDAPVTFHKAFDSTRDLDRSLDVLIEAGVARVLTSGGRRTAREGAPAIRRLVDRAAGRIVPIAAGSVRPDMVAALVEETGVSDVHLRAASERVSASVWSNPEQAYDGATTSTTDAAIVRDMARALWPVAK
jgi:copper homeostasis protein